MGKKKKGIKKELQKLTQELDRVTGTLSVIADGASYETDDCHIQDSIELVADYIRANITEPLDDLIDRLEDDDKED